MLMATLWLIAESQASDMADRSALKGFLSKYLPPRSDAPKSSMGNYDKLIIPNFKHGRGSGAAKVWFSTRWLSTAARRAHGGPQGPNGVPLWAPLGPLRDSLGFLWAPLGFLWAPLGWALVGPNPRCN